MKVIVLILASFSIVGCKSKMNKMKIETSLVEHLPDTSALPNKVAYIENYFNSAFSGASNYFSDISLLSVLFKKDQKVLVTQIPSGNKGRSITEIGNWHREGDVLITNTKNKTIQFRLNLDTLFIVPIAGEKIKDSSHNYLNRRLLAENLPHNQEKKKEGYSLIALGTEPFWSLNKKDDTISLKLMEWEKEIKGKIVDSTNQNGVITYNLKTGNKSWTVTTANEVRSDEMSDFMYECKVTIQYEGKNYIGGGMNLDD